MQAVLKQPEYKIKKEWNVQSLLATQSVFKFFRQSVMSD
jgi:hypothetical protein